VTGIGLRRALAGSGADLRIGRGSERHDKRGRQDKSAVSGRAHVVGLMGYFTHFRDHACCRSSPKCTHYQCPERRHHLQRPGDWP
jgi:hypothetical protein